jgi:hypothetical protein
MKKNILLSILFCAGILLSFQSCELFDPSKDIPSYVSIDSIYLITKPSEGSNSSKIKDAWVYIDNNLQGIYELPCTFPVLLSGTHSLDIKGGVLANGSNSVRTAHPFYSFYTESVKLIAGQKQYIGKNGVIGVNYIPQAIFALNEDFENTGFRFTPTSGSLAVMTQTNISAEVFEGKKSGKVHLDASHYIFDAVSDKMNIPINNNPIYVELNYKTENAVDLALRFENLGSTRELGIGGMYPSYVWGKIYFEISDLLTPYPSAKNIQLMIHAKKDESLNQADLLFDNIKIVHR